MRTTITIDDELFNDAVELTGITKKSALFKRALEQLIHHEASQQLAKLGGTMPDLKPIPRRRSK
jgi:Arc/MetJ family transcription regulator